MTLCSCALLCIQDIFDRFRVYDSERFTVNPISCIRSNVHLAFIRFKSLPECWVPAKCRPNIQIVFWFYIIKMMTPISFLGGADKKKLSKCVLPQQTPIINIFCFVADKDKWRNNERILNKVSVGMNVLTHKGQTVYFVLSRCYCRRKKKIIQTKERKMYHLRRNFILPWSIEKTPSNWSRWPSHCMAGQYFLFTRFSSLRARNEFISASLVGECVS